VDVAYVLSSDRVGKSAIYSCFCGMQRELKGRLMDLSDVEHSLDDTIGYLQQVETDLQQLDDVYGDPHFIETHIKNVQVSYQLTYVHLARCINHRCRCHS